MDFKKKYLKYKSKYLRLKQIAGGIPSIDLIKLIEEGIMTHKEAEKIMDITYERKLDNDVKEGIINESQKNEMLEKYKNEGKINVTQFTLDDNRNLVEVAKVPMYLVKSPSEYKSQQIIIIRFSRIKIN
jgi:hypothetical protein